MMTFNEAYNLMSRKISTMKDAVISSCTEYEKMFVFEITSNKKAPNKDDFGILIAVYKNNGDIRGFTPIDIPIEEYRSGKKITNFSNELAHHGILGQKWGVRRYQNKDGSLTKAGMRRYGSLDNFKKIQEAEEKAKIDAANAKYKARVNADIAKIRKKYKLDQESDVSSNKKTKKFSEMTDDELRAKISRIRLENELKSLTPEQISRGEKIKKELSGVAISALKSTAKVGMEAAEKYLKKELNKALGIKDTDAISKKLAQEATDLQNRVKIMNARRTLERGENQNNNSGNSGNSNQNNRQTSNSGNSGNSNQSNNRQTSNSGNSGNSNSSQNSNSNSNSRTYTLPIERPTNMRYRIATPGTSYNVNRFTPSSSVGRNNSAYNDHLNNNEEWLLEQMRRRNRR